MKIIIVICLLMATSAAFTQSSNVHFSHTCATTAKAAVIWEIWTDVTHWQDWDTGLKSAQLKGDFEAGVKGWIIPDKGPRSKFTITSVDPGRSYILKTKIPLGFLVLQRMLSSDTNGQTLFTHEVYFTGPLKGLFGRSLGKRYRKMLPEIMDKINEIALSK